jgi:hypothetical protein
MRFVFDIISEPVEATYKRLLVACAELSSTVILVVRDPADLTSGALTLLANLERWCIGKEKNSEWPGTILKNSSATVYTYKLESGVVSVLQDAADGLYEWVQPELPEDPCFLKADGSPTLVTIAHERDAYVRLTEPEAEALRVAIPRLRLTRRV